MKAGRSAREWFALLETWSAHAGWSSMQEWARDEGTLGCPQVLVNPWSLWRITDRLLAGASCREGKPKRGEASRLADGFLARISVDCVANQDCPVHEGAPPRLPAC